MQRPTATDMMKQRDEELDKKIEALRRKNEALMKRYQEVEEDKKKAEQEGMALQSRKSEDLSITINKTTNEPRVVMKKAGSGGGTPQDKSPRGGGEAADGAPNQFSMGRGKRRQLFVTMVGNNKGTRVVSQSADPNPQRPGGRKSSAEDEEEIHTDSSRRGRHGQSRKRTSQTQEDGGRQEGKAAVEESRWLSECDPYYQDAEWPEPQLQADLTIPTSREEQLEYLRWKAEREQIDRERVARHKNAKGQWRRAWDLDKPQLVFSDKPPGETERPHSNRGGRAARRGQTKSAGESQGHHGRGRDKKGKNAPAVVGSKAKGKDRLTGRARRWDTKDKDENQQPSETSLEEFLEELDALCDPDSSSTECDAPQNSDGATAPDNDSGVETGSVTLETKQTEATSRASPAADNDTEERGSVQTSSPKGTEKKVRFSKELVQGTHVQKNPNAVTTETKGSSLKGASSQTKTDSRAAAEPNDTADKPQQLQQQQQEGEADRKCQEEQDAHHVRPTGTEDGSAAAPAQEQQEEEKKEQQTDRGEEKDTDKDKETETDKAKETQPDGEAQRPLSSAASETAEAADRAPSAVTEGEASTPPEQVPAKEAPAKEALDKEAPAKEAPAKEAPATQVPATQPPEHTKTSTSRATDELIDSSLSVLSLDTGDTHPDHVTSTEKAREDGKVV